MRTALSVVFLLGLMWWGAPAQAQSAACQAVDQLGGAIADGSLRQTFEGDFLAGERIEFSVEEVADAIQEPSAQLVSSARADDTDADEDLSFDELFSGEQVGMRIASQRTGESLSGPLAAPATIRYSVLGDARLELVFELAGGTITGTFTYNIRCEVIESATSSSARLPDGRVNAEDFAAPVALYGGLVEVYAIDPNTGQGILALQVTGEEIAVAGIPEGENLILGTSVNPITGSPIVVSRLTSGELQLNTNYSDGKPYVLVWRPDSPELVITLAQ